MLRDNALSVYEILLWSFFIFPCLSCRLGPSVFLELEFFWGLSDVLLCLHAAVCFHNVPLSGLGPICGGPGFFGCNVWSHVGTASAAAAELQQPLHPRHEVNKTQTVIDLLIKMLIWALHCIKMLHSKNVSSRKCIPEIHCNRFTVKMLFG